MQTITSCGVAIVFTIGLSWVIGQLPPTPPVLGTGGTTTTLPGPPVGGTMTGETGTAAVCRNLTTGDSVSIPLGGATAWNCEAFGLSVNRGDRILQIAVGTAD